MYSVISVSVVVSLCNCSLPCLFLVAFILFVPDIVPRGLWFQLSRKESLTLGMRLCYEGKEIVCFCVSIHVKPMFVFTINKRDGVCVFLNAYQGKDLVPIDIS